MVDKYSNYDDLNDNEEEGDDYRIRWQKRDSGIAILAIHGGGIERGTTEIAEAVANSQHSFYTFEGLKSTGNGILHITSSNFDEPIAEHIIQDANKVLSIHGHRDKTEEVVYLGGLDESLGQQVKQFLEAAGFTTGIEANLQGKQPNNICNRGKTKQGVQLEVTRKLRDSLLKENKEDFNRFIAALRNALSQ